MPFSFQQHTANGSTSVFSAAQIDGYLSLSHLYVYVNDVLKTAGTHYTLQSSPSLQITFQPAHIPANGQTVRIQRLTPTTVAGREVDFEDGSVLTASDLDRSALQLLFIAQESEDLGSGALGKSFDRLGWNAEGLPINSSTMGTAPASLATKGYVDTLALYGGTPTAPQAWAFSGDGVQDTFTLSPVANATDPNAFIVEVGGSILRPTTDYTIPSTSQIVFTAGAIPALGTNNIKVRNLGVSRSLNDSVSTAMIQDDAVTSAKLSNALVAKINETVTAADFGAVGDGVADDTAALSAAFQYAVPLKLPVILRGTYRVTGSVLPYVNLADGELHVICDGNVTINVDPASTAFFYVFIIQTTNVNNVSFTGGSLQIDCGQKAAYGMYLRHLSATQGGTVNIDCPVTILNVKQNSNNQNAAGIAVYGDYYRIDINDATVIGVERFDVGVCRGIEVGLGVGEVTIRRPYIKNVLHSPTDLKDADGIAVAGKPGPDVFNDWRAGRVVIEGATFVDCQGRSMKSQCSDTVVLAPRVYRKDVVTIASGHDFDFQFGGGIVRDAYLEYRLNGSTSPLGASYSPVVFQNRVQDRVLNASCINTTIVSDVAFDRFCSLVYSPTALSSTTVIDGLHIQPTAAISTAVITRSIAEFGNAESHVVAMPGVATITVRNVFGPIDAKGVGYTGYSGGAIASKLVAEATNIRNTLAPGAFSYAIGPISGTTIATLDSFVMRDNHNIRNVFFSYSGAMTEFDFSKLEVGNVFTIDLAGVGTILNAPPWQTGTGTRAFVEVLAIGGGNSGLTKIIRVTSFGNASGSTPRVFISTDNATTWRFVGACPPVTKTADFTVGASEDVLINNKSGSACVVTLPDASVWLGRRIRIKNTQAQQVNSASSNVVPLAGGAAGTAILANVSGRWADLVSDGTNWVIMGAN